MSAVTKCDICGAIYRENEIPSMTFNIGVTEYGERTGDYDYYSMDCCPECTKRLSEFIDVLENGYEYEIHCKERT